MKYLHDDRLTQLTAELTDAVVSSTSRRMVNARIECFTTKRVTSDKKYAHRLGEKYIEELEEQQDYMAAFMSQKMERRCLSDPSSSAVTKTSVASGRKRCVSDADVVECATQKRSRSCSIDSGEPSLREPLFPRSALGDFNDLGTRRLMTDLILTLNACFRDYDFEAVRPSHFSKLPVATVMDRVNGRLGELAATTKSSFFLTELWQSLDNVIALQEVDVYEYSPPASEDEDALSFLTQTLVDESNGGAARSTPVPLWSFSYFFVNRHQKRIVLFSCVETMVRNAAGEDDEDQAEFLIPSTVYSRNTSEGNYDLDPTDNVAGGVPVEFE